MALQTKTFSVGDINSATLHFYKLELKLTEESTSTVNNTSKIGYTLTLYSGNTSFIGFATGREICLAGKRVAYAPRDSSNEVTIGRNSSVVLLSGTADVIHNADGTLNMSVAFSIDQAAYSFTPGPVSVTDQSMTLTAIARASTISATDANIGAAGMIAVNRKSSAYTHSIAYQFGTLSGYVTNGGISAAETKMTDTSVAFPIPTSFYAQIPNAKAGNCTLTCRTYSGSTQIGTAQTCTLTVTAKEADCAPVVSGSVVDSNPATVALTGNENVLVKYHSTALCTITATARSSATIKSKTIAGTAVSGVSRSIEKVETGQFAFKATDSRTYTGTGTVSKTLIEYIPLTCKPTARRVGPTTGNAALSLEGNYFGGSFGAADNTLTVSYRIKEQYGSYGDPISVTPDISGGKWSAAVDLTGLTHTSAWEIEVTAKDKLETLTKTVTVTRGIPVFDWGADDFNVNAQLKIREQPVADFIVEQGTSGIWTYRKWNSGAAECWGTYPFETSVAAAWGSLYESSPVTLPNYPFTFSSQPAVQLTQGSSDRSYLIEYSGSASRNAPGNLWAVRPNQVTGAAAFSVNIYAGGRWK